MPIDENNAEDLILSDIAEIKSDEKFKTEMENVVTCAFNNCTELNIVHCRKCNRPFCIMHSNRFSPNFCKECFTNISCVESKFTRTFESYNEDTDKLTVVRDSCTRYYMDGPDWPFLTGWIDSLSDDELRAVWNFHFFVMKTIEAENEVRKIKKLQKLRLAPTPKVQGVKTAKTILTKTTQVDTAEDVRKRLKKQGLPDVIIEQMITAMNLGK